MKKLKYEIQVVFRINDKMEEDLLLLCKTYGQTRADVMRALITTEADKLRGNPKLTETIEKLKQMEIQLKHLSDEYK